MSFSDASEGPCSGKSNGSRFKMWRQKNPNIARKLQISDMLQQKKNPFQIKVNLFFECSWLKSKLTSNPSNYMERSLLCFKVLSPWMISEFRKGWNPLKYKKGSIVISPADFKHRQVIPYQSLPPFQIKTHSSKKQRLMYFPPFPWQQSHQKRSPPRRPRSRSPSPRHISMTTRHTCWWILHSQISPEGTSVCLWVEIKEIGRLRHRFLWSHKGCNKKTPPDLDFCRPHDAV